MASEFQQRTKQWRRLKTRRLMQAESHCGVPNGRNRQSIRAALRQAAPLRGCRADCAALSRAALSNPARSGAYLPRAADFARACRARWEQAAAAHWRQVGSHCWSRECLFAARESCHFDCVRQRRSAGEDVRTCGPVGRRGGIVIVALRRIEPGEEIAYDYGREYLKYFLENGGCRCAACCRKRTLRRRRARRRRKRTR